MQGGRGGQGCQGYMFGAFQAYYSSLSPIAFHILLQWHPITLLTRLNATPYHTLDKSII